MTSDLVRRLEEGISRVPVLDVHTHLDAAHLSARGLADVLLYHMVGSDLYSAGCPRGDRVAEGEEAERIRTALPYLPYIVNTSCYYGVTIILRDLYGFDGPITAGNWEALDDRIRAASTDPGWGRRILEASNVRRAMTQDFQRREGQYDDILEYSFERTYFCMSVKGKPADSPLRELESLAGREVHSLDDVHDALGAFLATVDHDLVRTTAGHFSTDLQYRPVTGEEMAAALARRTANELVPDDANVFANYLLSALLAELEKHADTICLQFSLGAEPLPFETGSKLSLDTVFQLADVFGRFPKLRFNCLLGSEYASQALCTVARQVPNLSFSGYWWHSFFPGAIRKLMNDRLDMLPLNKQVGFFSDAYCAEWVYAKKVIVQQELARVLAEKVERGQYTEDTALRVVEHLFWESPKTVVGMGAAL
jgi:glucuronate isomerase